MNISINIHIHMNINIIMNININAKTNTHININIYSLMNINISVVSHFDIYRVQELSRDAQEPPSWKEPLHHPTYSSHLEPKRRSRLSKWGTNDIISYNMLECNIIEDNIIYYKRFGSSDVQPDSC